MAHMNLEKEIEKLFKSLSVFDVKSNKSLENTKNCDSKLAILANIVSRGLPTIAPVEIEEDGSHLEKSADMPAASHRFPDFG